MLLALSNATYVLIGWFKFLLLKFLYEYVTCLCVAAMVGPGVLVSSSKHRQLFVVEVLNDPANTSPACVMQQWLDLEF